MVVSELEMGINLAGIDEAIKKIQKLNEETEKYSRLQKRCGIVESKSLRIVTRSGFIAENIELKDEALEAFDSMAKGFNFVLSDGRQYYSVTYLNRITR